MTAGSPYRWKLGAPRTVFISGGSSGIGRNMARHLAAEGAHIALFNRSSATDVLQEMRAAACRPEQRFCTYRTDVAQAANIEAAVRQAVQELGAPDLAITTATLAFTVGSTVNSQMQATGGFGPRTWTFGGGTLPPGVSLGAGGRLTGTPTRAGVFPFEVVATDSATPVPHAVRREVTATVTAADDLGISTSTLPSAGQGDAYNASLRSTGGVQPIEWSLVSGTLPPGLRLDPLGTITGAATRVGTSRFVIAATDDDRASASRVLELVVGPGAPFTVSPATLPAGVQGASYLGIMSATGGIGAPTWAIDGTLPPGLELALTEASTVNGLIGVPTSAGTWSFNVRVTDQASPPETVSVPISVTVGPAAPLVATPSPAPTLTQGYPVFWAPTATGGVYPYTWSLASGSLPAGLTLTNGVVTGQPSAPGSSTFALRVSDSAATPATATFAPVTWVVNPSPFVIATTQVGAATAGSTFGTQLVGRGGTAPYTWSISSGSLPPGLTLASDGMISGRPTSPGVYPFILAAHDSSSPATTATSNRLSITVTAATPLSSSVAGARGGTVGTSFYQSLVASGGAPPYTWALASGTMPPGLKLLDSEGEPIISGNPTAAGTFPITLALSDSSQVPALVSVPITITIDNGPLTVGTSMPRATAGLPFSGGPPRTGGIEPMHWVLASGTLPAGLTITPSTGLISGTPSSPGTSNIVLEVTDSASPAARVTAGLTVAVDAPTPPLAVTAPPTLDGRQGARFAKLLGVTGGVAPYTWSLASGSMPAGLTLSALGTIEGTPTATGTTAVVVRVTDSAPSPATTTAPLSIVIAPPTSTTTAATSTTAPGATTTTTTPDSLFTITTPALPNAIPGTPYSVTMAARGGDAPYTWSVAKGRLPAGFTLAAGSGIITGTPSPTFTSTTFSLRATDASGRTAASIVTIAPSPGAVVIRTGTLPDAVAGSGYQAYLEGGAGWAPYSWKLSAGTLPDGLALAANGTLSGVPANAGTFSFTVSLRDGGEPASTATKVLTLTVGPAAPLQALTAGVPGGTQGMAYYRQLLGVGGLAPYTWSVTSGALPAGLSLSALGVIAGVPTATGATSATVTLTDSATPTPHTTTAVIALTVGASGPKPAITATGIIGRAPLASTFLVSATQSDGNALNYTVDFGDGTAPATGALPAQGVAGRAAHVFGEPGSFVVRLTAVDPSSNLSASVTQIVRVSSLTNRAPVASIDVQPASGVAPFTTAIKVGGVDPDEEILTYTLDFGDGTEARVARLRRTPIIRHTYANPGSYAALLTVTDGFLTDSQVLHVLVVPAVPLTAVAGDDQVVSIGDVVSFSGAGSQPVGAVQRYSWDFGDGASGSGAAPSHAYRTAGVYKVGLTVSSPSASDSDTTTITVKPAPIVTGLKIGVVGDGVAQEGAQVVVLPGDGQKVSAVTDATGVATLMGLPDGEYAAKVYKSGYKPTSVAASVRNGVGNASVTLTPGPVATVSMTSHRMNYREILAAGIDPAAPANQNVVRVEAHLAFEFRTFQTVEREVFDFGGYICNEGFCGDSGFGDPTDPVHPHACSLTLCVTGTVKQYREQKTINWLVVPIQASWLKEFFDVQLLVTNVSDPEFLLTQGSASIELPPGLALADTKSPQSVTQPIPDLAGGQSKAVHWYVRGDDEGSYTVNASYSALLQPFDAPISLRATTRQPIKVWGGSALRMTIEAQSGLTRLSPYIVRVGLTNVTDSPVYNPAIELLDEGRLGYIPQPRENLRQFTATIKAGDTFWATYVLAPWIVGGGLVLEKSFVKWTGGNTSVGATITTRPPPADYPNSYAKAVAGKPAVYFAAVPGAVGYDAFATSDAETPDNGMQPDVPFGPDPIASVEGNDPGHIMLPREALAGMSTIGISTRFADGHHEMMHPLVVLPNEESGTFRFIQAVHAPWSPRAGEATDWTIKLSSLPDAEAFRFTVDQFSIRRSTDGLVPITTTPARDATGWFTAQDTASEPGFYDATITGHLEGVWDPTASKNFTGTFSMRVRPDKAAERFVALGDSFSSGEGLELNEPFWAGTDRGGDSPNACHRSESAYSIQLFEMKTTQLPRPQLNACSGARSYDLADTGATENEWGETIDKFDGQYGEPLQTRCVAKNETTWPTSPYYCANGNSPLPPKPDYNVSTVTLTISGNDLQFSTVFLRCLRLRVYNPFPASAAIPFDSHDMSRIGACFASLAEAETKRPPVIGYIDRIILQGNSNDPNATVYLLGYPQLFNPNASDNCTVKGLDDMAPLSAFFPPSHQREIDAKERIFNAGLKNLTNSYPYVNYVDSYAATAGHALCDEGPYLNGLDIDNNGKVPVADPGSFHPRPAGYKAMAVALSNEINRVDFNLLPGQSKTKTITIKSNDHVAKVKATIPGSEVRMTLVSPSGLRHDESDASVRYATFDTGVIATLTDPDVGDWTAQVTGVDVDPAGEPVKIDVTTDDAALPTPVVTLTTSTDPGDPNAVTLSAAATPPGQPGSRTYAWDFDGDGTADQSTTEPTVLHRYERGRYAPTVTVTSAETTPATDALDGPLAVGEPSVPTANPDTYVVAPGDPTPLDVLANDEAALPAQTFGVLAEPAHGSATAVGTKLDYTPAAGYSGPDALSYVVCTAIGACGSATISIYVGTPPTNPVSVATPTLPDGRVGRAYSEVTLEATGGEGPFSWSIANGQLPLGLTLDAASGRISGTPTTAGVTEFTLRVTDSAASPSTATEDYRVSIAPGIGPLDITTTQLPSASLDQAYLAFVAAEGGLGPMTWSVSDGALPPGVSLDASDGALRGTPRTVGVFEFTVTVTDGAATVTRALRLEVRAPGAGLAITTSVLPQGVVGTLYPETVLGAAGGTSPFTWAVIAGSLPAGLSLDAATGTITGTPTTVDTSTFTVSVTDSAQPPVVATRVLGITVTDGPTTTTSTTTTTEPTSTTTTEPTTTTTTTTTVPAAAPTVTAISPSSGTASGGTEVTITGTDLAGTLDITFGGTTATAFSVLSPTSILATTPPHAPGPVDVVVTTPSGPSTPGPGAQYLYTPATTTTTEPSTSTTTEPPTTTTTMPTTTTAPAGDLPDVRGLLPNRAGVSGGAYVLIMGRYLGGATQVTFGGVPAQFAPLSNDLIVVRTPPHSAGRVDVIVTTPRGSSPVTRAGRFTYQQRVCFLWKCWWG